MPNLITVAGGPRVNDFPVETMRLGSVDYGLAGYCEKTFPKLVEALDQDKVSESDLKKIPNLYYFVEDDLRSTPPSTKPVILDDLPYPKRELVNLRDYYTAVDEEQMTTLYTSRGCPFYCTFCASHTIHGRKLRLHSLEHIFTEIDKFLESYIR